MQLSGKEVQELLPIFLHKMGNITCLTTTDIVQTQEKYLSSCIRVIVPKPGRTRENGLKLAHYSTWSLTTESCQNTK